MTLSDTDSEIAYLFVSDLEIHTQKTGPENLSFWEMYC